MLSTLARGVLVLALAIVVLGFGAIGLCGGYITLTSIPALLQGQSVTWVLLVFSVPCLIAGIVMVKVCGTKIWHLVHTPRPKDDLS